MKTYSDGDIGDKIDERMFSPAAGFSNRWCNERMITAWGEFDDRYRDCGGIVTDAGLTWNHITGAYLQRYGEQLQFLAHSWYQSVYIEHYWGSRSEFDSDEDSDDE